MITNYETTNVLNAQIMGLSTDTKPTTGVQPNSLFWELDTNGMYFFDGTEWQAIGEGGGGGGYDIDIFVDSSMDAASTDNSQILSGSYASVREKLINGEAVRGILHSAYDYNEVGHYDTAEMFYLSSVAEDLNGVITLVFFRMSAGITTQMVNPRFSVSFVTLTEDGIDSIKYSSKVV